jgi:hypothetical protein
MHGKSVIVITVILGCLLIVYFLYKSKKLTHLTGYGPSSSSVNRPSSSGNMNHKDDNPTSYLEAIKRNYMNQVAKSVKGSGADDLVINGASNTVLTDEDIDNYSITYTPVGDIGVTKVIDPGEQYDKSSSFNDPNNSPQNDNVQYNLYASPDENSYETITSKQLYNESEYPAVVDRAYQTEDFTYYLDDNSNILNIPRDSINKSEKIDPALTDGIIYYPSNDDVNNQNLLNIMKETLDDRASNTSPVYLQNNVLDTAVFSV